jgi:hypothetical protein
MVTKLLRHLDLNYARIERFNSFHIVLTVLVLYPLGILVEEWGIEPQSTPCKGAVIPLYYSPES